MEMDGKRILIFAPRRNTGSKKDATGAFQPEAGAFAKRHGIPKRRIVLVDNAMSKPAMRKEVLAGIETAKADAEGGLCALAFFCHGMGQSIQFGFDTGNVSRLASAIAGRKDVIVVLYACNTAKGITTAEDLAGFGGDGGFADGLRDALCRNGAVDCQVDAHTTAGHTTMNPYVRRFEGMGSTVGGAGGFYILSPTTKPLWKKWRDALRSTNLRYDFPFMSVADIHAAL
ncbi:MAG: hypothetical protein PHU25_09110 [Deltaproteobacteria bacterium]|nr:hypothetical protein [Deltaproteobacteria bacterium]